MLNPCKRGARLSNALIKMNQKISVTELLEVLGKPFQWRALEKRKRKGNYWSQKIECKKTGVQSVRHGTYKTKRRKP